MHARPDPVGDARPPLTHRAFCVALLLATLLGAGLRLHALGEASLWVDEVYTLRDTDQPLDSLAPRLQANLPTSLGLRAMGVDVSEMDLTNAWRWKALGITPWRARLPTCLIGILSVPLLGLAARRVLGDRAALISALLLAVHPWHVEWSQTARFYVTQFLFYNLALVLWLAALESRSFLRLAGSVVSFGLAILVQPVSLVLALVFASDAIVRDVPKRVSWRGLVTLALVVLVLGLLAVPALMASLDAELGRTLRATPRLSADLVARVLARTEVPLLVLGAAAVPWLRRERPALAHSLVAAGVLPVACLGLLDVAITALAPRYVFPSSFAWIALAAVALDAIARSLRPQLGRTLAAAPVAFVVLSLIASMLLLERTTRGFHPRWQEAFDHVASRRLPDDRVLSDSPAAPYYLEDPDVLILGAPRKYLLDVALEEPGEAVARADAEGRRTWLVLKLSDPGALPPELAERAELRVSYPFLAGRSRAQVYVFLRHPPPATGSGG